MQILFLHFVLFLCFFYIIHAAYVNTVEVGFDVGVPSRYVPAEILEHITAYIDDPKEARAFQNLYRNRFFPTNETNSLVEAAISQCDQLMDRYVERSKLYEWGTACSRAALSLQHVYHPRLQRRISFEIIGALEKLDAVGIRDLNWEHVKQISDTIPSAVLDDVPWPRLISLREIILLGQASVVGRGSWLSIDALRSIPVIDKLSLYGDFDAGFFKQLMETVGSRAKTLIIMHVRTSPTRLFPFSLQNATDLTSLSVLADPKFGLLPDILETIPARQLEKLTIAYEFVLTPREYLPIYLSPNAFLKLSSIVSFACFVSFNAQTSLLLSQMRRLRHLSFTLEIGDEIDAISAIRNMKQLRSLKIEIPGLPNYLGELGRALSTLPELRKVSVLLEEPGIKNELARALPDFLEQSKDDATSKFKFIRR